MSFDIPMTIEPEIIRYAKSEQITPQEAVIRLIQAGLSTTSTEDARIQELLGEPMNVQDAAMMDEVVEMAMRARSGELPQFLTARRGPRAPLRTDDAHGIIGMFAGKSGFQEAIESVIANRSERYGKQS
ncbi:MAG: hypothetical protein ACLQVD_07255 [Capsulimonadaceae bacterium]